MYSDDDEVIEVAGGLSEVSEFALYSTYARPSTNWTTSLVSGERIFSLTSSTTGAGVGTWEYAALYLPNDGSSPPPVQKPKLLFSKISGSMEFSYTASGNRIISTDFAYVDSSFTPSTVTTMAQLQALSYTPISGGTISANPSTSTATDTVSFTNDQMNGYIISTDGTANVYGIIKYVLVSAWVSGSDTATITVNFGDDKAQVI